MKQIRAIISVTIKETFRNRLIGGVAVFGLILIGLSNLISKFTMQEQLKFIKDMGLSGIAFFGQLMAIIAGSSLIADDYEQKTINQVLTNPVKPSQYILGRYFGILMVLLINVCFFTIIFYGSLLFSYITSVYRDMQADTYIPFFQVLREQIALLLPQNIHLLAGIWLIFVQMMIIAALALMLSFFFSKIINFVICFVIFIVGHITLYMSQFIEKLPFLIKTILSFVTVLIPSFEYFNISDYLVLNRLVSLQYHLLVCIYAVIYIVPVLLVSILIFDTKEIK